MLRLPIPPVRPARARGTGAACLGQRGGWVKQGKGSWSCDSTFCETQRTHPPRKPRWSLEPLCHSLAALQTRKPWFVLGLGGAPGTVWALALRRGGGGYGVSGGSQLSLCHLLVTLRSSTLSSKTSFQRQPPQRALMRAAAPPPPPLPLPLPLFFFGAFLQWL